MDLKVPVEEKDIMWAGKRFQNWEFSLTASAGQEEVDCMTLGQSMDEGVYKYTVEKYHMLSRFYN